MSSYECQEPGCTYNAYAAGPILTDEDMEMQDYMNEEIRAHEERHEEEKMIAQTKPKQTVSQQVQQRDGSNCRVCGKDVFWKLGNDHDAAQLIHIDQARAGVDAFIVGCLLCKHDVWLDDATRARLIAGSQARTGKGIAPLPNGERGDASEIKRLGLKLADAAAGLWSEPDGSARRHQEPVLATLQLELDQGILGVIQSCLDARASGREVLFIEDPDLVAAIKDLVGHVISPSVGAPSGAGVGTSEPTGGDEVGDLGNATGSPGK